MFPSQSSLGVDLPERVFSLAALPNPTAQDAGLFNAKLAELHPRHWIFAPNKKRFSCAEHLRLHEIRLGLVSSYTTYRLSANVCSQEGLGQGLGYSLPKLEVLPSTNTAPKDHPIDLASFKHKSLLRRMSRKLILQFHTTQDEPQLSNQNSVSTRLTCKAWSKHNTEQLTRTCKAFHNLK